MSFFYWIYKEIEGLSEEDMAREPVGKIFQIIGFVPIMRLSNFERANY